MYCRHFKLSKKPFQIASDNRFLWQGPLHRAALHGLVRGIAARKPLLVLTGDVGTGKTTLLNEIVQNLAPQVICHRINDPFLEMHHLLFTLAQGLGFESTFQEGRKFSRALGAFLGPALAKGRQVLILVDEAQRIENRFLREILSWSTLGLEPGLTVLLSGQLELSQVLETELGPGWEAGISFHASLSPLTHDQTRAYIQRRLEIAGSDRPLFSRQAVDAIFFYARGFPRLVNIACDQAMITAFGRGEDTVDLAVVTEALGPLALPGTQTVPAPPERQPPQKRVWPGALAAALLLFSAAVFIYGDRPLLPQGDSGPGSLPGAEIRAAEPLQGQLEGYSEPGPADVPLVALPAAKTIASPEPLSPQPLAATDPAPPARQTARIRNLEPVVPPLEGAPAETSATPPPVALPLDVEGFVNEVFLLKTRETARAFMAPEGQVSEPEGLGAGNVGRNPLAHDPGLPEKGPGRPEKPEQRSSVEIPDPAAVIDYVLKKKQVTP